MVDGDGLYLDLDFEAPPVGRPLVYLDMVASVDGAVTVEGRSGGLGGEGDKLAFRRLRESCDLILVGAGTARAEDYGPPNPSASARERRVAAGRSEVPVLAVVTRSGELDREARMFRAPGRRTTVVTTVDAPVDHLTDVADILRAGHGEVDLAAAMREFAHNGIDRVLVEGGPSLNRDLLTADLVDEVFVTVAPWLVGLQERHGIIGGDLAVPRELLLVEHHVLGSELLLRYRVDRT